MPPCNRNPVPAMPALELDHRHALSVGDEVRGASIPLCGGPSIFAGVRRRRGLCSPALQGRSSAVWYASDQAISGLPCLAALAGSGPTHHSSADRRFSDHLCRAKPRKSPDKLARRAGWSLARLKKEGTETDYNLAAESFEVHVPQGYDGVKPYGLLVWISPSPSAKPMQQYLELLDKHHLIYIGANKIV